MAGTPGQDFVCRDLAWHRWTQNAEET